LLNDLALASLVVDVVYHSLGGLSRWFWLSLSLLGGLSGLCRWILHFDDLTLVTLVALVAYVSGWLWQSALKVIGLALTSPWKPRRVALAFV